MKRKILLFLMPLCLVACKPELPKDFVQQQNAKLIQVKAGAFMMGDYGPVSSRDDPNAFYIKDHKGLANYHKRFTFDQLSWPPIPVSIKDYAMDKTEVTEWEFELYLALNELDKHSPSPSNLPVTNVTWDQASNYCQWVGSITNKNYHLPSEAQWEFAARNRGQIVAFATNNGDVDTNVNISDYTRAVASFAPNPLGFYDLTGNANEWVQDWYQSNEAIKTLQQDYQGAKTGLWKISKGFGAFSCVAHQMHNARRLLFKPEDGHVGNGFRCSVN